MEEKLIWTGALLICALTVLNWAHDGNFDPATLIGRWGDKEHALWYYAGIGLLCYFFYRIAKLLSKD